MPVPSDRETRIGEYVDLDAARFELLLVQAVDRLVDELLELLVADVLDGTAVQRVGDADDLVGGLERAMAGAPRRTHIVVGDEERLAVVAEGADALEQALDRYRLADQVVDAGADQPLHVLRGPNR